MDSVLLIDGNPFIWRSVYSKKSEQFVAQDIVNFFYNVFKKFNFRNVLIFGMRENLVGDLNGFPDTKHKEKRKKEEFDMQEIFSQRDTAIEYLKAIGVRNISVYGVEADDLIAFFSDYFSKILEYNVVVASSDHDLWQLVDEKVFLFDPLLDKMIVESDVQNSLGILPNMIPDFKAIVGDVSDNIKGINGLGEKSAVKILEEFGGIEFLSNLSDFKSLTKNKKSEKIAKDFEEAEFCYQLVKLPRIDEFVSYLNTEERRSLKEKIVHKVKKDKMAAQILGEMLGVPVTNEKVVSSLDDEILGALPYLEEKPPVGLSTLSEIDLAVKRCCDCTLRGFCENKGPTLAAGLSSAEIMIVGRNPGHDELIQGIPFVGKAGKRLDQFLEFVGISREECWITNSCKCFSINNRPPTYGELMQCSKYLRAEIDILKPKFIMCFGNEAMSLLTPYKAGVMAHCGEVLENPVGMIGEVKAFVGIVVHPSAALRNPANEINFQYGAKKIKEFLDGKR